MCGIAGIMYKNSGSTKSAPIGDELVKMLETMVHRGHDSAGVTVSGEANDSDLLIRLWANDSASVSNTVARTEETIRRAGGAITSSEVRGSFLRIAANYEGDIPQLADALLNEPEVSLHVTQGGGELRDAYAEGHLGWSRGDPARRGWVSRARTDFTGGHRGGQPKRGPAEQAPRP